MQKQQALASRKRVPSDADRFIANAAKAMLVMIADGQVLVNNDTHKLPVRSVKDAVKLKSGKLRRHVGIMKMNGAEPDALKVWSKVQARIERVRTMTELRALAGGK